MDLLERICEQLNAIDGLPSRVHMGYMQPDNALGLYPLPGSRTIEEDWAGNQTRQMNYEVAIRTKDQQLANQCMWQISDYIDRISDIQSKDNSFQFNDIQQNGLPSVSEQDDQGYSVYMLDFFVEIVTNNRGGTTHGNK